MNPRQIATDCQLASFCKAILPWNNSAKSCWKQNANAKPMTNDTATIRVDSAISFKEISLLLLPKSLRVAISLARKPVFATVRLM